MNRTVTGFEFQSLGVNTPDYFQGAGTAFTGWDEVYVGVGDTEREAAEDAWGQSCQVVPTCETAELVWEAGKQLIAFDNTHDAHDDCDDQHDCPSCRCHDECELHYYCALYVKFAEEDDTGDRSHTSAHESHGFVRESLQDISDRARGSLNRYYQESGLSVIRELQ